MRKQIEILFGIILAIASSGLILWFAFNEESRMLNYSLAQEAEKLEIGAILFDQNCSQCHGDKAQGSNLAPCLNCEEFFTQRTEIMGWDGDLRDYIIYTISNGREISSRPDEYPGGGDPAMPIWSEKYGGPLQDNQISSIAEYIINFEPYALSLVSMPEELPALISLANDPVARGKYVFLTSECSDCHEISGISEGGDCPPLNGIASNASDRIQGYSAEEYIRESILFPAEYKVEVEKDIVMPPTFGKELTESQINDLITFLLSLDN